MIKLISSDMDGTLLNSYRQITPINIEAIKKAQENGINFIINTVKLNIVHTMDIHNVILTINPRLLGIGSILLNAKIMHINVHSLRYFSI